MGYLVDLALFGVLLEHLVEVVEGSRVVVVGARHLGELVQQRVVRVALVPQVQADQGRVVGPVTRVVREATSAKEGARVGVSKEKSSFAGAPNGVDVFVVAHQHRRVGEERVGAQLRRNRRTALARVGAPARPHSTSSGEQANESEDDGYDDGRKW